MTISVVIPTYNGAPLIRETIACLLRQRRPPDEIIIYDDNSSDDTLAICADHPAVLKIYGNHTGPSGFVNAWNNAIELAKGEYICLLHQDDLLDPDFIYIAEQIFHRQPDVLHFFSTCYYIDGKGAVTSLSYRNKDRSLLKRYTGTEYMKAYQQTGDPHIHRCAGVITHSSIFKKCRFNPGAGHIADDDFYYRVGQFTDVIGFLRPLAYFRHHSSSETGRLKDGQLAFRLACDYIFQCRQWRGTSFMDKDSYYWFRKMARKFIRRSIGYSIRSGEYPNLLRGIYHLIAMAFLRL